ncbi:MAG: asparagine synthase (glutamine-hydrolyzing) [Acidobacteria bacterium]|nr:MAG: asparagine synthase (glutamine-hydrolyzing) [Acidobacteriota bacterium]
MCSIFGEFFPDGGVIDKATFLRINELSKVRGPDQHGYSSNNENYQCAFNRLAILDLTQNGNQPVFSPSHRYLLLFNGEVYNYKALAKKYNLECSLRSKADTEVVIQLIGKLGVRKAIEEFDGMFAIAVLDFFTKRLFLARDFAGIKPLFFGISKKGLVFSSQFNQVAVHPAIKAALSYKYSCIKDFLQLGYMPSPSTIFKNVFQVQPGEIVEFTSEHTIKKNFYFRLPLFPESSKKEMDPHHIREGEHTIKHAVWSQLISERPLGSFLSSGIDSPLIASYASKKHTNLTCLTVKVQNTHMDEAAAACKLAKHLKVHHKTQEIENNKSIDYLTNHISLFPEPFGDYSSIPTYEITKKASDSFTVMLSGDGGDELFWGYPRMLNSIKHSGWFNYPTIVRKVVAFIKRKMGKKISYGIDHPHFHTWVFDQHCKIRSKSIQRLLPGIHNSQQVVDLYSFDLHGKSNEKILQWLKWNEYYDHLQRVLVKVDRMSMANSLEVRVPFLAKDVIKYSLTITPELGISHIIPKYILKQLFLTEFSTKLQNSQKMGFQFPLKECFQLIGCNQLVEAFLLDRGSSILFDNQESINLVHDFFNASLSEWGLWHLLSLTTWIRAFNKLSVEF